MTADPKGFLYLDPRHVAVLLVDFQNDFCSPDVFDGRPPTNTHNADAAHRANDFAERAVAVGATVVYTQQVLDLERRSARQRRADEHSCLCVKDSWGAELFIEPVAGSHVITKDRYDCWQKPALTDLLELNQIDGLVICGVELVCCVLYAVLGADERGYDYLVPSDLVSGQDTGDSTDNRAVRDFLHFNQPHHTIDVASTILTNWNA